MKRKARDSEASVGAVEVRCGDQPPPSTPRFLISTGHGFCLPCCSRRGVLSLTSMFVPIQCVSSRLSLLLRAWDCIPRTSTSVLEGCFPSPSPGLLCLPAAVCLRAMSNRIARSLQTQNSLTVVNQMPEGPRGSDVGGGRPISAVRPLGAEVEA